MKGVHTETAVVICMIAMSFPAIAKADQPATSNTTPTANQPVGLNEIIVTARKKSESDLEVPIAIKAFGQAQIERYGIQNLSDVAAVTPSLSITQTPGNTGGSITLRGIGSPASSSGTDQAVAINLDGVTISDGMAINFSQFDLERVEVLQGPQSLYYGKNSSAGIISIYSADPTNKPYAMLRAGYNFQARGKLTEAVLSGPITDGLSARIAFYRNDQDGYFHNAYTGTGTVTTPAQLFVFGPLSPPRFSRSPNGTDTGVRGTLKYQPSDALTIRLKGGYIHHSGSASTYSGQLIYCPAGAPSPLSIGNVPGVGECKPDTTTAAIGQGPNATIGGDPRFGNGDPVQKLDQYLFTGDVSYDVSELVRIDSVTGYYKHNFVEVGIPSFSLYPVVAVVNANKRDQFSQEVRISTSSDRDVSGLIGFYYQSGDYDAETPLTILQSTGILPSNDYYFHARTYSGFGQLTYRPFGRKIEVSAGARYTDEVKTQKLFSRALNAFATDLPVTKIHSRRLLPEVNISWHPNRETNVFFTWKKGAKSGGFNADILALPPFSSQNNSYNDERVSGFEGGLKSVLFDGALRFDLTAYAYTYKDLQVSVFDTRTNNSATRNAASAKTRGIQLTTNYAPKSIPGFNLSGSLNYSHARYTQYLAQCYTGQTIALGCNLDKFGNVVATGAINQSLDGRPTAVAPDWSGDVNAGYEFPITSDDTRIGVTIGATYTDTFNPLPNLVPQGWQRASVNLNAEVRVFNERGWELALIGKNLTNQLRAQYAVETPFTPGLGVDPKTGTAGPGIQSDLTGFVNPPRQVMLRLTIKPWDLWGRK